MGYVFRRVVNRHRDLITLVALTQFARSRFLADGFDGDQMVVRPNFSSDLGPGLATRDGRLLYVGRLSDEKGADIVVKAAARVRATVEIVGDGPQAAHLRSIASPNVLFAGRISRAEVANKLRSASAALVPSRCYESFPMIVAEAMSCATPIIGSDLGALAELVDNRKTGRLVVPDSVDAWVQAMNEAVENPEQLAMWGLSGRRTYAARYDENHGYDSLVKIYQGAIAKASARQIRLQSPLAYGLAQSAGGYARQQQSHS
jgi:glycosyltransferase involved in cell wall biosynthesis